MSNRDNFTPSVKKTMAERVAWRCSFPNCGVITVGPKMGDDSKSMNLGEAAHIHAASPDGPRYDATMSSVQRKAIQNGIWMCRSHATFIDADFTEFSAETLRLWKAQAEEHAYNNLKYQERYVFEDNSTLIAIGFKIIINGHWESAAQNEWRFKLDSFLKGSRNELDNYISNLSSIKTEDKFVLVESQGDARKIKEPIEIIYGEDGKISLVIKVENKYEPIDPNLSGCDLAIGDDGDISFENGDLKMVSGMDAAIQHLTVATGTVYGEWWGDPTVGSFVSEYYRDYHEDLETLSKLIKLEFIRLSLIPTPDDENNPDSRPALGFVNRFERVTIKSPLLVDHKLSVDVELEWGNHEKWAGNVPIWINET
ncbi:HNH endonuclease [Vibrio nitrifigilis]|uniref:HNH endonuclease n=1 Tax=Vibrio nitrifigilis TaxID=2789781 RepID=A0ABS0GBC2_9VIBR|nr:HNH endonuclease [Vibrio nitrifigilis]MBF8999676.1 HNH endonuclease [Vibrio nitrifigilis]